MTIEINNGAATSPHDNDDDDEYDDGRKTEYRIAQPPSGHFFYFCCCLRDKDESEEGEVNETRQANAAMNINAQQEGQTTTTDKKKKARTTTTTITTSSNIDDSRGSGSSSSNNNNSNSNKRKDTKSFSPSSSFSSCVTAASEAAVEGEETGQEGSTVYMSSLPALSSDLRPSKKSKNKAKGGSVIAATSDFSPNFKDQKNDSNESDGHSTFEKGDNYDIVGNGMYQEEILRELASAAVRLNDLGASLLFSASLNLRRQSHRLRFWQGVDGGGKTTKEEENAEEAAKETADAAREALTCAARATAMAVTAASPFVAQYNGGRKKDTHQKPPLLSTTSPQSLSFPLSSSHPSLFEESPSCSLPNNLRGQIVSLSLAVDSDDNDKYEYCNNDINAFIMRFKEAVKEAETRLASLSSGTKKNTTPHVCPRRRWSSSVDCDDENNDEDGHRTISTFIAADPAHFPPQASERFHEALRAAAAQRRRRQWRKQRGRRFVRGGEGGGDHQHIYQVESSVVTERPVVSETPLCGNNDNGSENNTTGSINSSSSCTEYKINHGDERSHYYFHRKQQQSNHVINEKENSIDKDCDDDNGATYSHIDDDGYYDVGDRASAAISATIAYNLALLHQMEASTHGRIGPARKARAFYDISENLIFEATDGLGFCRRRGIVVAPQPHPPPTMSSPSSSSMARQEMMVASRHDDGNNSVNRNGDYYDNDNNDIVDVVVHRGGEEDENDDLLEDLGVSGLPRSILNNVAMILHEWEGDWVGAKESFEALVFLEDTTSTPFDNSTSLVQRGRGKNLRDAFASNALVAAGMNGSPAA